MRKALKNERENFGVQQIPSQLKELVSKVPNNSQFTKRHGQLLSLVMREEMVLMIHLSKKLLSTMRMMLRDTGKGL